MKFLSVLLSLTSLAFTFSAFAENSIKSIRIAANLPLSGELASYGVAIQEGMIFALEDSTCTKEKSPEIKIDWQDNQGNNSEAAKIVQMQKLHGFDLYISGLKPQTMVVAPEISKLGVPHLTWILDTKINNGSSNNFRVWVNFKREAEAFLSFLKDRKLGKVAMLYAQLPAAEIQFNQILAPELRARGATEVWVDSYTVDTTDFRSLVLKLKEYKPDTVILNGFVNHLVPLIRSMRQYKTSETSLLTSLDMLEAAPLMNQKEIEGIVVAVPDFLIDKTPAQSAWNKKFAIRFKHEPLYHSAYAYDALCFIKKAASRLKASGGSTDLLKTIQESGEAGITGPLKFDTDNSLIPEMESAIYQHGQLRKVQSSMH